ncbi:MAG TPA: sigma-70 family RNA polymerase sigma factor [Saprospiraceae bacterium]|nr:sigma-70 family RNA polymerase sigma factor [Saprospiraceae bacterium]
MSEKVSEKEKNEIFEGEFLPLIDDLYNFAYHLTLDEFLSEDLVQETYFKAYKFISSYQKGTNAKAWLFRILKNEFINIYRKKERSPNEVSYNEGVSFQAEDKTIAESSFLDLRDDIFQNMLGDEVSLALNSLPVDYRTVIVLCDLQNFKYEEIADILEIPIGTVRSRLYRARNELKEKLKTYAKRFGYKDKRK